MLQCPVCSAELVDDFGLVTCGQCQSPLLIQMDGTVEKQEPMEATVIAPPPGPDVWQGAAEEPADDIFSALLDEVSQEAVESPAEPEEPMSAEEMLLGESQELFGATEDQSAEFDPGGPAEDFLNESETPAEDLASFDSDVEPAVVDEAPIAEDFAETPAALPPEKEVPSTLESMDAFFEADLGPPPGEVGSNSADLSDLGALANSTEPATAGFHYSIQVSGIDTAEIRLDFRELLTDKRFLWDTEQILKSIQNGRVRIDNISAVKTYLLVHRLRELPVHVVWEQNGR